MAEEIERFQTDGAVEPAADDPAFNEMDLSDVLAELQGFGIEENEEILTIKLDSGKSVQLKISTVSTQDETESLIRCEQFKGHLWIQNVKIQMVARAITNINGLVVRDGMYVRDSVTGENIEIRTAIANMLSEWGVTVVGILWKILMVHTQRLEDKLIGQFSDATIMTQAESTFLQRAMDEIDAMASEKVEDMAAEEGLGN